MSKSEEAASQATESAFWMQLHDAMDGNLSMSKRRKLLTDYRAAVLLAAADRLDNSKELRDRTDDHMGDVNAATDQLRIYAREGQS